MERKRRLQYIGDSFYIALPPDWVKHWKLKKGDELTIVYGDKPIVVIEIPEPVVDGQKQK